MSKEQITYEQPLNELIRACIKIEHLFKQLDVFLSLPDYDSYVQAVVKLMVDVLNILDRPDLKTKLSKEFERFITIFSRLHASPEISQEKLETTLKELKQLKDYFIETKGKFAQKLRDNEFLANVRQNLLSSGGDSCIDSPGYYYWLNLSPKIHRTQVQIWLNEFKDIRQAVELLLRIVRNSSEPNKLVAEKGFYHESLNPHNPCQLIRVSLDKKTKLFPEIIAGRHRLSIRFVVPSVESHPKQFAENVKFWLTKCVI